MRRYGVDAAVAAVSAVAATFLDFTNLKRIGIPEKKWFFYKYSNFPLFFRYDTTPEHVSGGFQIGPVIVSVEQIGIGVMSNLVTLPVIFLIVFFFRKARRRILRENR